VRSTPSRRQHEVLAQSANPCDEDATHPFCVLTEAIELEYDGPLSGQDRIAGQGAAASSSPSGGSDGTRRRPPQQRHRLPPVVLRMPNTAFGIAMGLGGHAVMWKGAGSTFIQDYIDAKGLNYFFWLTGVVVGMCITTSYIFKALTGFQYIVDEFRNPGRIHFMNAPHLATIMLTLSVPSSMEPTATTLRAIWVAAFFLQTFLTQFVYEKWMFSKTGNIGVAQPPFMLSTVGWFLLAVLGYNAGISSAWGINLPAYCLGAGLMLYLIVVIAIFNRLHMTPQVKGSPALTLLMAPPSVAVVAIDLFDNDPAEFNVVAEVALGWSLLLVVILIKLGPSIAKRPAVLGAYWAYIFPPAALATATLRNSTMVGGTGADVFAMFFVSLATIALIVVVCRMCLHGIQCVRGNEDWSDPLFSMRMMAEMDSGTHLTVDEEEATADNDKEGDRSVKAEV